MNWSQFRGHHWCGKVDRISLLYQKNENLINKFTNEKTSVVQLPTARIIYKLFHYELKLKKKKKKNSYLM